jgi:YbgC/YbaW family acyl-CoA thioester hydrolase
MITESNIDVRYPDCDAMGIVHHAVYPIWYEIARMDFFAKVGFSYLDMHEKGINPPMVNLNLQYFSPVRYPGQVTVRTSCTLCQGKKLELRYNVYQEKTLVAAATSFHIWTGPDMKSLDMASLPEVYEKFQSSRTVPAVLIMAGGRSTRMGRDKAKAELGGRSLLQRAVDFWQENLPEASIYVAVGQQEHFAELPKGVTPVYDLLPDRGPLGGLQAAFRETGESLLALSAVDMPLLRREALELLQKKRPGCEDICVFTKEGRPEPLFGFYRSTCLPTIDALLEAGDNRLSSLISAMRTTLVPLPEESWVTNVNTPQELEKAEAQLEQ